MLLYGSGLNDMWIAPDLIIRDFNEYLLQLLRQQGYSYALFYNVAGREGAYCIDEESARFFFDINRGVAAGNADRKTEAENAGTGSRSVSSRFKSMRAQRKQTQESDDGDDGQIKNENKRFHYNLRAMDQSIFLNQLDSYMDMSLDDIRQRAIQNECKGITNGYLAFVIDDISTLQLNDKDMYNFANHFTGYRGQTNRNLCILKAPQVNTESVDGTIENIRRLRLQNVLLTGRREDSSGQSLNASCCFAVGAPGLDEVTNLVRRLICFGLQNSSPAKIAGDESLNDFARELYQIMEHERHRKSGERDTLDNYSETRLEDVYVQVSAALDMMQSATENRSIHPDELRKMMQLDIPDRQNALEALNRPGWENVMACVNRLFQRQENLRFQMEEKKRERQEDAAGTRNKVDYAVSRVQIDPPKEEPRPAVPNFMLLGSPGTGKTTIARLLGRYLKEIGILRSGHTVEVIKGDLTTSLRGETGRRVLSFVDRAEEGVLFVDEAHSLGKTEGGENSQSDGQEVLSALVSAITSPRRHFCLILAGYEEPMKALFKAEPGLMRRMGENIIVIPDYKPEILFDILLRKFSGDDYTISPELLEPTPGTSPLYGLVQKIYQKRDRRNFGNADAMIKLAEAAEASGRSRVITRDNFIGYHLPNNETVLESWFEPLNTEEAEQQIMDELDALVGLENVKAQVHALIETQKARQIQVQKAREEGKEPPRFSDLGLHTVFSGSPGTGKTTVARMMGRLYYQMGILSQGQVIEVSRKDLVGEYVGHTAVKTQEVCEKALGGVLFIDEAYSLSNVGSHDFGQEAIDTLVKFMEDNRSDLMVIVAGYKKEMKDFMEHNSGLTSRFINQLEFEDYNGEEMLEIFKKMAGTIGYLLDPACEQALLTNFRFLFANRGHNFGNGRTVRNIFERMISNQSSRVNEQMTYEEMMTFRAEDMPSQDQWAEYCG